MRAAVALAALLGTVACAGETEPPKPRDSGRLVTSLREIAGPWDIVRFGGHAPGRLGSDGLRRAYVDVGAEGLSYTIECNYSGNPARIDETGTLHDEGDGSRVQTQMGCGPEREARDSAFFAFFGSRPKVRWAEGGRLIVSNGTTELILERPEQRRLAYVPSEQEISGRWVPRMATRLIGSGGHEGWGFQEPTVLTIAEGRIAYSGCGGFSHDFRYAPPGQLITGERRGEASCGDNPGSLLLRVLDGDPLVERAGSGGLALQSGNLVITLESEEAIRRARENPPPPPPGAHVPPPPPTKPRGGTP